MGMLSQDWEEAIARAVVERSFRSRLLADPADTLADYGCRSETEARAPAPRFAALEQLIASVLYSTRDEWLRIAALTTGNG